MSFTKLIGAESGLSSRQRWGHYLAVLFALVSVVIGTNLRDSVLYATTRYVNTGAGIRADYPRNWLIDTEGNYIFRIRNTAEAGFPTTIQVAGVPVSSNTAPRYVLDALTLNRSQTLASYKVLSSGQNVTLSDESAAALMTYTFAAADNDPFLESVPVVVRGDDIVTIKQGQAIIITFLSNAVTYDANYPIFERFVSSLEF